jgi:transcriptional regulator with XRE-family HTH domain
MATLGEMIREHRIACGMTQHQVGLALGTQNQIVSNWERGGVPDPRNLARLVALLNIDEQLAWLAYARLINESLEEL